MILSDKIIKCSTKGATRRKEPYTLYETKFKLIIIFFLHYLSVQATHLIWCFGLKHLPKVKYYLWKIFISLSICVTGSCQIAFHQTNYFIIEVYKYRNGYSLDNMSSISFFERKCLRYPTLLLTLHRKRSFVELCTKFYSMASHSTWETAYWHLWTYILQTYLKYGVYMLRQVSNC